MTRDGPPPRPGKPPKLRNSPLQRTKVCFPSVLHIVVHLCGQIVSTLSFICAGLRGLGDRPGASRLKRNRKPKARKPESPKSNTSVLKLCGALQYLICAGKFTKYASQNRKFACTKSRKCPPMPPATVPNTCRNPSQKPGGAPLTGGKGEGGWAWWVGGWPRRGEGGVWVTSCVIAPLKARPHCPWEEAIKIGPSAVSALLRSSSWPLKLQWRPWLGSMLTHHELLSCRGGGSSSGPTSAA